MVALGDIRDGVYEKRHFAIGFNRSPKGASR